LNISDEIAVLKTLIAGIATGMTIVVGIYITKLLLAATQIYTNISLSASVTAIGTAFDEYYIAVIYATLIAVADTLIYLALKKSYIPPETSSV
jgi:hypothetical protein